MAEYRKGFMSPAPMVFSVTRRGGDVNTSSWYYISVNELKKGDDRKHASVLMQPAKVRTLAYLLEKARTYVDAPEAKFPLTLFIDQTGKKKDSNETFSYGRVEIIMASRQEVKLRVAPAGNDKYPSMDFELPFDTYGTSAGNGDNLFKSYAGSLGALSGWIMNEYAHYEAGGTNRDVNDKGAKPKTDSTPAFESYGGDNEGEAANIPF